MKKKIKLLYAEDEYVTRENHINYIKSRYEFEIYVANNGEEALSMFHKHAPQIVMTDINMPKMTGLEFIKEIRKVSKHTKIIILTAYSDQDKLLQALESQVVNYLVKPINRKKLTVSLDTALEMLKPQEEIIDNVVNLGENASFCFVSNQYIFEETIIKLSNYENKLLEFLCRRKSTKVTSHDIFSHLWDNVNKEYNPDSVRTLIKNLRKKLPNDILENIYGGFYRLNV